MFSLKKSLTIILGAALLSACGGGGGGSSSPEPAPTPVSYTHLTLPTIVDV